MYKFHSLGENTGADQGMARYLSQYGFEEVSNWTTADIVVFNGGADIATELYGEALLGSRDGLATRMSHRDIGEREIFRSRSSKQLMLGICRGAQFCNVLSRGGLWQDVNNHGRDHEIRFSLGTEWQDEPSVRATSTHHQMMQVGPHGQLLAYAIETTERNRQRFFDNTDVDPEIVWYPNTHALCIQGHPEYRPTSDFSQMCVRLINHYVKEVAPSAA